MTYTLIKSLDDQGKMSEKEKNIYIHQILNQEFGLAKSIMHLKMEYHPFTNHRH